MFYNANIWHCGCSAIYSRTITNVQKYLIVKEKRRNILTVEHMFVNMNDIKRKDISDEGD